MGKNWADLGVLLVFTAVLFLSFAQRGPKEETPTPSATPTQQVWKLQLAYRAVPPQKSWTATFQWLDKVGEGTLAMDGKTRPLELSQKQLLDLRDSFERERLWELKPHYEPAHGPSDGDELDIEVETPHQHGKVQMRRLLDLRDRRDARRALRIFSEVLRLAGSPNDAKPLEYLQTS